MEADSFLVSKCTIHYMVVTLYNVGSGVNKNESAKDLIKHFSQTYHVLSIVMLVKQQDLA